MSRVRALLALLLLAAAVPAHADDAPVTSLSDGRTGHIRFESVTPSGYFALVRRDGLPRTVVVGTLRRRQLHPAQHPADGDRSEPAVDRRQRGRHAGRPAAAGHASAHRCRSHRRDRLFQGRPPALGRTLVTGRNCDMRVDVDRFTVVLRATGEDITTTASAYARSCLTRGATIGGDPEARRRAPDDVKSFLQKALAH